jgi:hypothetical protein
MLSSQEVQYARERLAEILDRHELGWIVRHVDDAIDEGLQPNSGDIRELELRRLVLLVEATQRALSMTSELEEAVPDLLLGRSRGRRVHIEPDVEGGFDTQLRPSIVIERDASHRERREAARVRTHQQLTSLLHEAIESR